MNKTTDPQGSCYTLRFEHCYTDEDLMKEMGRICSSTHPATMEKVSMSRYRALLQLFVFPDSSVD